MLVHDADRVGDHWLPIALDDLARPNRGRLVLALDDVRGALAATPFLGAPFGFHTGIVYRQVPTGVSDMVVAYAIDRHHLRIEMLAVGRLSRVKRLAYGDPIDDTESRARVARFADAVRAATDIADLAIVRRGAEVQLQRYLASQDEREAAISARELEVIAVAQAAHLEGALVSPSLATRHETSHLSDELLAEAVWASELARVLAGIDAVDHTRYQARAALPHALRGPD